MLELPWGEFSEDQFDLKRAQKILDRDHYGLEEVKKRIIEYLAVLKLRNDMKSPILCLYGPPGVGKTSLGKSVAEALGHIAPERTAESDGALAPGDFGLLLAEQLASGGPWGQHFPEPLFDGQCFVRSHRIVGEKHLKLTVDADGTEIEGIAFNIDVPQWLATPLKAFHALYRLDVNEYRGERRPQLVIESFWPC